ncbi:hypothetical protein CBR_g42091 [Chara braunii]|uniref:Reverse transcriptase domain-containing protein n=1 Tax=Chara braunii TaxID=69332 RepID=A0A388LWW2_CHABU|nr:hypothetical protein CBR_g42091 [Chara braunii]|eukprot:GBG86808.1 hypothetical protein CBR_g42091 [Chara braunii]
MECRPESVCQFGYNSSLAVYFDEVVPRTGALGDLFIARGSGFSPVKTENEVDIGGRLGTVLSANYTTIIFKVHRRSKAGPTDVSVTVQGHGIAVKRGPVGSTMVLLQALLLRAVRPQMIAMQGTTLVTLTGSAFDSVVPSRISVRIAGIPCTVRLESVTENSLVCASGPVPPMAAAPVEMIIQFDNGQTQSATGPMVTSAMFGVPFITMIDPDTTSSSAPGDLKISGGGFRTKEILFAEVGDSPCSIDKLVGDVITCKMGPMKQGKHRVVVTMFLEDGTSLYAQAPQDLEAFFEITSFRPTGKGSMGGGTLLTITGRGFVSDSSSASENVVVVQVPKSASNPYGGVLCDITSSTTTELACKTRPHCASDGGVDDPEGLLCKHAPTPPDIVILNVCENAVTDIQKLQCWVQERTVDALCLDTSSKCMFEYAYVKNNYPMLHVDELFDRLAGNRFFTKINFRSGYHQIRVATEDQPKTTFRSRFGHYEFTVMPFGLTNAPGTFQTVMNDIFRDILEEYVLVYLDGILVYSRTLEDHLRHLCDVL